MPAHRTRSQRGLGPAGKRLWDNVLAKFELDEHETALLREACRTADTIEDLQKVIDKQGLTDGSFEAKRMNPALSEIRQQRIVLTRVLSALGLPRGVEGLPQAKPRGHHPARGVRSLPKIGLA